MSERRLVDADLLSTKVGRLPIFIHEFAEEGRIKTVVTVELSTVEMLIADMPEITLDDIKNEYGLVSIEVLKQIMRERDIAIEQLKELGYEFGEKIKGEDRKPKARWINAYPEIEPNPMFMYGICSNCGYEQGISNKLKFCPECGFSMVGGDDSE